MYDELGKLRHVLLLPLHSGSIGGQVVVRAGADVAFQGLALELDHLALADMDVIVFAIVVDQRLHGHVTHCLVCRLNSAQVQGDDRADGKAVEQTGN